MDEDPLGIAGSRPHRVTARYGPVLPVSAHRVTCGAAAVRSGRGISGSGADVASGYCPWGESRLTSVTIGVIINTTSSCNLRTRLQAGKPPPVEIRPSVEGTWG